MPAWSPPAATVRRQSRPMKISKGAGAAAPLEGVEVRQSEIHGLGVFALRDWRVGEEIGLYADRRYAPDESHASWNDQLTYLFGLSDGSVIDGAQGGNATRHINHACTPNVEAVERYADNDELKLVVRAICRLSINTFLSVYPARSRPLACKRSTVASDVDIRGCDLQGRVRPRIRTADQPHHLDRRRLCAPY